VTEIAPAVRPADIDPLAERRLIRHPVPSPEHDRQTATSIAMTFASHPFNLDWRAKADVLLEQLHHFGWEVVPVGPICADPQCCQVGCTNHEQAP
jgi:hypothetical protein